MPRLADAIARWLGRVELVLGGADAALRDGQIALTGGDAVRARAAAHEILARVPGSPIGLALLADACELGHLDAEHAMALEELAQRAPSRADVWVRVARAREAGGAGRDEVRDALLRALAVAEPGSEARPDALLALADLDLAQGEPERAELWLDRLAPGGPVGSSPAVALRRAEARVARGDAGGALGALKDATIDAADARANLVLGRAHAMAGSTEAFAPLLRATILEAPGAGEALSSALGWIATDEATRARVRAVVDARGEAGLARWRAAFARAEGRRDEARAALVEAVRAGERDAARPLLDVAIADQDAEALAAALAALPETTGDARSLATALATTPDATPGGSGGDDGRLDALRALTTPAAIAWADAIRRDVARSWVPPDEPARWSALLARLELAARGLHDLDASARLAALSAERRRPLRVAIVGEFNAGKSTFINALVGAEIAPTGVLPTTATLHHLRYAPDPVARVLFVPGHEPSTGGAAVGPPGPPGERIVPVADLRGVLKSLDARDVRRVEILLPLPSLTRVEILDTPGFNAPDASHAEAARTAFDEADAAIWLVDAGQPMKRTERDVLREAQAARVPVQVLVNKADRLAPADRERVLAAVNEGLAEAGLASASPPLLFSARRALAGKLGDAAALADSGWAAVDGMLEAEFVARSEALKERALRRRALAIVAVLGRAAAREADAERAADDARRARLAAIAQAAARIDRDAERVTERVAEGLAPAAQAWAEELAIVGTRAGGPAAAASDPALARYRVDRALAHLARPLGHAMAGAADGTGLAPSDLAPLARTAVRAFAGASAGGNDASSLVPLARAAVASLVEHLGALAASPAPSARAAGVVGELTAFAEALRA